MNNTIAKIRSANWPDITESMNRRGFALIPNLLTDEQCEELKQNYSHPTAYRKTVEMERHQYGLGEYKYFHYPLPDTIQNIRTDIYPYLAQIANAWSKALKMDKQFPLTHPELLQLCHSNNQVKATVLILKYGKGGYNALHQDLYGDVYFPIQLVLFLNEQGKDYTGGEFVLTQQIPRSQSKAFVVQPAKGDALIFTTKFRPEKGIRGYHQVNMKHGVSEVHAGERYTLGIIFHDAV